MKSHLSKKIGELEAEGFQDQLMFQNGKLINLSVKKEYLSSDVAAVQEFRFEGQSNPSDLSLLFAITFSDQRKGTLTAAYGPKGDAELLGFMNEVNKG